MNANETKTTSELAAELAAREQRKNELRDEVLKNVLTFVEKGSGEKRALTLRYLMGETLGDNGKAKEVFATVTVKGLTGTSETEILRNLYAMGSGKVFPVTFPKVRLSKKLSVQFEDEMSAEEIAVAMGYDPDADSTEA